jgi:hypothetical protein
MSANAAAQQLEVVMRKDSKGPSANHERPSSFVSLLSGWAQQGLESFFATQRILVDLAMRQNTSAMKSIRQGISESEAKDRPMNILTEMAVEGTANYIEAQRILLDLAQQENEIVLNGVKERVGDYGTAVALTNVLRRSIDTLVDMQQNFLVLASKRSQGWLNKSEGSKNKEENRLIGIAGEVMEEFVSTQKKFLKVISEETSAPMDEKKVHAGKPNTVELAELGRNAAGAFIDAQKKLLDLAGQQVNVNMQTATRALKLKTPIRLLPVADMAGESVKSFVDAEKALLNSMTKSRTHAEETEKKQESAKPAARRPKVVAARPKAARAGAAKA